MGGPPAQQRCVEIVDDLRQLVGGGPCRCDIPGGTHDLDERGQQPRPRHPVVGLVDYATDPGLRGADLPLRQS